MTHAKGHKDGTNGDNQACTRRGEGGFVAQERRHDLARRIERLDAEIDALVYELYGLTEEDIKIVEGRA